MPRLMRLQVPAIPRSRYSGPPKVLVVVGTRPEAIKLAPVIRQLADERRLTPVTISTAQHGEAVPRILSTFGIAPARDLDVLRPGESLTAVTTKTLGRLAQVLLEEEAAAVVVQGDTTSAFAGALAAFQVGASVVHVEAGLRTGDRLLPFPEEMNRRLVGQLADVHCAPTPLARDNLLREGVNEDAVHVTGNTVVDALRLIEELDTTAVGVAERGVGPGPVVVTLHRRETWGKPLLRLCEAIASMAVAHASVDWVVPMHPNPSVRDVLVGTLQGLPNVRLTEPIDYPDFIRLVRTARLILTDSGGIQEEAPSLGVPVIVLRDRTERPEVLETGLVHLVGTEPEAVIEAVERILDRPATEVRTGSQSPIGDGWAAARVEMAVAHHLGLAPRPTPYDPKASRQVGTRGS